MSKSDYKIKEIALIVCFSIYGCALIAGRSIDGNRPLPDFIAKKCQSVGTVRIPIEDRVNEEEKKSLTSCDAEVLYYGNQLEINQKKTLQCAIATKDYGVLMMIYANGYGVKKNMDLALHFACKVDREYFSISELVNELILMAKKNTKKTIDLYGYLVFPLANLHLIDLISRIDKSEQDNYAQNLIHNFTTQERGLYEQIKKSEVKFINLHNESDMESRADIKEQEEVRLKRLSVVFLKQMATCQIHEYGKEDYLKVDKILNSRYQDKIAEFQKNESAEYARFLVDRLKKTEREWIHNKYLWEQLGQLRCPQINPYTWSTILTRERAIQLTNG